MSNNLQEQDPGRKEGRTHLENVHGGLAVHVHSVSNLLKGAELTSVEKDTLRAEGSNAINSPYVWKWKDRDVPYIEKPTVLSPHSDSHLALFAQTKGEYEHLYWQQMRLYLGGEEGLQVSKPESPVTPEEWKTYLATAQQRGIVTGFSEATPTIPVSSQVDYALRDWIPAGVIPTREHLDDYREGLFTPRFKKELTVAALHKLGTYLALVEQMAYEGNAIGESVKGSYIPVPDQGTEHFWEGEKHYFGGETPTLKKIYEIGRNILLESAGNDEAIQYLLPLSPLLA